MKKEQVGQFNLLWAREVMRWENGYHGKWDIYGTMSWGYREAHCYTVWWCSLQRICQPCGQARKIERSVIAWWLMCVWTVSLGHGWRYCQEMWVPQATSVQKSLHRAVCRRVYHHVRGRSQRQHIWWPDQRLWEHACRLWGSPIDIYILWVYSKQGKSCVPHAHVRSMAPVDYRYQKGMCWQILAWCDGTYRLCRDWVCQVSAPQACHEVRQMWDRS